MRITIDLRMLHSSGIGVYLQNLIPRIIRLRKSDYFYLLGKKNEQLIGKQAQHNRVQWIEVQSPIYSLSQQIELLKKIPKGTDLLWVPHFDIPVFYKGKMLVTVHDLFHLAMPRFVGGLHKRLYAQWMFRQTIRKASAITTVSQFTKRELIRFTGCDPKKINAISLGVDSSWFNRPKTKSPYPRRPYFLYVGNIKLHKNLSKLLTAFERIMDQVSYDLVLVGKKEGFITGDLAATEQAAALGNRVLFTGYIDDQTLKKYFFHAAGLIFPSLYEGFGLPVLEAMASGCPVAASSAASIPEVCGNAALYFDPNRVEDIAEKMLKLARDKKLRSDLKSKGFKRARLFSWEKCAAETNRLIDHLAAQT